MCEAYRSQFGCNFISAMPTNLYGPNDNYDLEKSHVLPALIRKFHEAKITGSSEVVVWGSGKPMREFLHVDDLGSACLLLMNKYDGAEFLNVGFGSDISISNLSLMISNIVGFTGKIIFDTTRADGTGRKLMDSSKIMALGWRPKVELNNGISETYDLYKAQLKDVKI